MGETTSGSPVIGVGAILEGRYEIVRELGAGAMGIVYEGRHRDLGKRVAVKTLHADLLSDPDLIARFRQEAQAASAIGHPNIVEVFDLGTVGGSAYMVMEFLEGRNLGELLDREPTLMPERAGRIISQVLSALGAAHQQGIVHRDLKPENIFLSRRGEETEFVKLLDFGIAKVLAGRDDRPASRATPKPTEFGMVMGTPQYMSPEQARGLPVDYRTDLWSAGAVLYEMLSGRTPFQGDNYNQIMSAIIDGSCPRITDLRPSVPEGLAALVHRAMSQRREDRFDNAIAMRHELHRVLSGGALPAVAAPVAATEAPSLDLDLELPADDGAAHPLADSQTGLAAAAAGATDASFAAAHSLAEIDMSSLVAPDGSSDSPPPSAPAASAPAPATAQPAAPAGTFGPPPEEGELALDLAGSIAEPVRRSTPRAATPRPSQGRPIETIHRPQKRSFFGTLVKLLLVLLVIGGGAGAAYRYYTLGYLISPPPPKPVPVEISVRPSSAEIFVDGETLTTRPMMALPGTRYEVEVRAPGRLSVRYVITDPTGGHGRIDVRLPHGMATLSREQAAIAPAPAPAEATTDQVDHAMEKLEIYGRCIEQMREPRQRSHDAYAASLGSSKPRKGKIPNVVPIDGALLAECRLRVEEAGEREPQMDVIEQRSLAYLDALAELVPMTRTAAGYYSKGEYAKDDFAYGRKTHGELVDAFARSGEAERALAEAVIAARFAWSAEELHVVEQAMGKTALWHLRNVALAAESWVAAEISDRVKRAGGARVAFAEAIAEAEAYAGSHEEEITALPGAKEYLRGLAPLRQLAAKDSLDAADRSEILTWYNKGVELFNRIVITR